MHLFQQFPQDALPSCYILLGARALSGQVWPRGGRPAPAPLPLSSSRSSWLRSSSSPQGTQPWWPCRLPPPQPTPLLPVVTSESLWEGAPAGGPGDGGWQRCGVVPRSGEAEFSPAPPGRPSRPSTTTTGRPGPGTHPESLLLAVPAPPQPGRAVQLQQSLQNLLPWGGQNLLPARGRGPRPLGGFGVPKASLLLESTGKP